MDAAGRTGLSILQSHKRNKATKKGRPIGRPANDFTAMLIGEHAHPSAVLIELHGAFDEREQCIVLAHSNIVTGMEASADLAHQYTSRLDTLTAEFLHTTPLGI
jgi:hypothetical protein